MPAIESLRCFVEAARLRSFRAAARAVALSPAAFGQRIRQLEEELNIELFHRTTRTIILTEAGINVLPHAQCALAAVQDCVRVARGKGSSVEMELTLGTRHELGLSWIVPMLPKLQRMHPGLTMHLYFGSGTDLVRHVRTLAVDCAVTSTRLTDSKVEGIRLHEEQYVFVGQPKLLERRPFERPDDARHHTLIDTTEELPLFRYWRDAPGGIDSIEFGRVLRMGTIAAIRHLVLRGTGVAVLPRYYVAKELHANRLASILPAVTPLSDHFRLIFRADDPRRSYYRAVAASMAGVPLS